VDGIRAVAPRARVRVSPHATAPTAGYGVGIVAVGEKPYAEGHGDVGNGGHLSLSTSDRTAIDRVCGAMRCVVLVVAGRPQILTDELGEIDALVASWLPGGEGAGVADVLFGRVPFTGKLPVSWPRGAAQEPINAGDADYDPLYPYGYGLAA
jgi:beta-glucosidase